MNTMLAIIDKKPSDDILNSISEFTYKVRCITAFNYGNLSAKNIKKKYSR
jgi:hypothetical protein